MINRVLSPGSQQRRPQLGPSPGHLHLLLIELCIQDHLCKATTWGIRSFGILVGALRFQIPHIFSQSFVQRMNLKSPQSSLDGCGFPSLFVGVGFLPTPTVQVTTLPAFQGVMDRLQEVISQELNGFPIILGSQNRRVLTYPTQTFYKLPSLESRSQSSQSDHETCHNMPSPPETPSSYFFSFSSKTTFNTTAQVGWSGPR